MEVAMETQQLSDFVEYNKKNHMKFFVHFAISYALFFLSYGSCCLQMTLL